MKYDGDVWDFYAHRKVPETSLPLGVLLTHAAAGSEMSYSSVITNEDGNLKRGFNALTNVPTFSLLNPEWSYTLPPYQTACGAIDIMAHLIGAVFYHGGACGANRPDDHLGHQNCAQQHPGRAQIAGTTYDARAEIMWAGALAHNSLLQRRTYRRLGDA